MTSQAVAWPQIRPLLTLGSAVLTTACLYWGQAIFIPVALALLLTFLLSPLVGALERHRLGRIPSTLLVVSTTFLLLGGVAWLVTLQLGSLATALPSYRANLLQKTAEMRGASRGSALEKVQETVKEVQGAIEKDDRARGTTPKATPVVVAAPLPFTSFLPSVLGALATTGLVIALVIFMLLERQDLRNRLIRLIGYRQLTVTTQALDEASGRVSRYLLMQSLINGSFGLCAAAGLLWLSVPYAALWGVLAAILRFVPYVGPWAAASMPLLMSLAAFSGWTKLVAVGALFVVLELLAGMVIEPWIYGRTVGVSSVALLVAIAFWTWLWGPVGLMLATPMTVCFIVIAKYLPGLEFVSVLFGDEPIMPAQVRYYQRLLARDQYEAEEVVNEYVKAHGRERVYDDVLIPALYYTRRDWERTRLSAEGAQSATALTREILEDLASSDQGEAGSIDAGEDVARAPEDVQTVGRAMLGIPARDEIDATALEMLRHLMAVTRWPIEVIAAGRLTAEVVELVRKRRTALVCIGSVGPGSMAQARHLCKRLRSQLPALKIVIGCWGWHETTDGEEADGMAAGADHVATRIIETRRWILEWAPVLANQTATPARALVGNVTRSRGATDAPEPVAAPLPPPGSGPRAPQPDPTRS